MARGLSNSSQVGYKLLYPDTCNCLFLEEQQLKLAMARSLHEDDECPDDAEISDELDSQSDYINMTVSDRILYVIVSIIYLGSGSAERKLFAWDISRPYLIRILFFIGHC